MVVKSVSCGERYARFRACPLLEARKVYAVVQTDVFLYGVRKQARRQPQSRSYSVILAVAIIIRTGVFSVKKDVRRGLRGCEMSPERGVCFHRTARSAEVLRMHPVVCFPGN
jgi:hypothetical protein